MFRFYPVVIFLYLINPLNAQQVVTFADAFREKLDNNSVSAQQKSYLNSLYVSEVDIADELINGREYIPYYFKCKIRPLLFEEKKRSGSLVFNGRGYYNLSLEYDTYLDQLIYSDSSKLINDRLFKIALNKDPVDAFHLNFRDDSMTFRYFTVIKDRTFNLADGFYEVVYDGKSKCIIKHQSFPVEKDGLYEYRYTPAEYVMVGKSFTRVRSGKTFIRLFGKDSDAIRKYMRTNRVHFRRANKHEIAAVLRYYDAMVISNK
jgi:hypothetical protein